MACGLLHMGVCCYLIFFAYRLKIKTDVEGKLIKIAASYNVQRLGLSQQTVGLLPRFLPVKLTWQQGLRRNQRLRPEKTVES